MAIVVELLCLALPALDGSFSSCLSVSVSVLAFFSLFVVVVVVTAFVVVVVAVLCAVAVAISVAVSAVVLAKFATKQEPLTAAICAANDVPRFVSHVIIR